MSDQFTTGQPQANEAAAYYGGYIALVVGDDALKSMEAQLDEATAFLFQISEERSLHRYAAEKWSIRQVLNHVSDTERAFAFRALWFARGFDSPLPSYEQDIAAAGAGADRVAWAAHIEEFRRVRLATLSLFRNMPPEHWMRTGIASGNSFTVRSIAFIIPGHVTHHMNVLRQKYL